VQAQGTENVLYNFCSQGGSSCTDGATPPAGLIFDSHGSLYGTTQWGGANCSNFNCGTVFELSPPGGGTGPWTENVLHSFSYESSDGSIPQAGLIFDSNGNLYGTTLYGGNSAHRGVGGGTVFELGTASGAASFLRTFFRQSAAAKCTQETLCAIRLCRIIDADADGCGNTGLSC
jgi:hypothetical protein